MNKPTKSRTHSFLGIHFDFHAMPGEKVPSLFQPEVYEAMLDAVRPDFVQCDTKGHAGLSSYPTTAGNRADLVDGIDILRTMRDATAKRGIALYGHHSGIFDQCCAQRHPEWAVVNADGSTSTDFMSVFGPYVDQVLIPQLRELAGIYNLDGAWVDGENWAAQVDYGPWAVAAYKATHNNAEPPRPKDANYLEYKEFCREGFRAYVRRYVEVIHREFPNFQITSNWIFSGTMPEKVDVPVDFLSGDYAPTNSVLSARTHGRVIEGRHMTWDLMAWGHNAIPCSWKTHNRSTKELAQYCQEAAMVIAMGGAFQFFNIHYGHGGILQRWMIPTWGKVAEFCRQRQACFKSRIRPELGVLLPMVRNGADRGGLYDSCCLDALSSWMDLLQDCQFSTKVLFESQLSEEDLSRYKVIVVPAMAATESTVMAKLETFVRNGGSLLVDSPAAPLFAGFAGFRGDGTPERQLIFVEGDGALAAGETICRNLTPNGIAQPVGQLFDDNFMESPHRPAAMVAAIGQGNVAALAFDMAVFYRDNQSTTIRNALRRLLKTNLGYTPTVEVTGSRFADVTITEKNNRLLINLINVAGEHNVQPVRSYDEIPSIGPLTVSIDPSIRFRSAMLQPENTPMGIKTDETTGRHILTVPFLKIHSYIDLELES